MWLLSFLDSTYERAIWWHDFANVVLILSLIAGLLATFVIIRTSSTKEEYLKRDLANTNERAAQAEARAAEANLELAKFKAPRSLTGAQQKSLKDALKSFSNISIDVIRYGETPEIVQLSTALVLPLKEAGWNPRDWNVVGGGAATGVLIVTKTGSADTVEKGAVALVTALQAVGIASAKLPVPENWGDWGNAPGIVTGLPWERDKVAPIRMIIGTKP